LLAFSGGGVRGTTNLFLRYAAAALIVAGSTAAAELFFRMTGSSRITSIFLASVLISAFLLGSGPGFLAAGLSFVIYLYLVDPPYQLSFGSPDDFNSLFLYLAAAILTCLLAGRVRDEAAAAKARALTATSLVEATREFSATADEPFLRQRLAERLAAVWGQDANVEAQHVRVLMAQLRTKLEANPSSPRLLRTETGVGYRLEADDSGG